MDNFSFKKLKYFESLKYFSRHPCSQYNTSPVISLAKSLNIVVQKRNVHKRGLKRFDQQNRNLGLTTFVGFGTVHQFDKEYTFSPSLKNDVH